jgi:hypothetical protein
MSSPTQTEIAAKNHRRAVRFFWAFLIGATTVSLIGNIAHAVLPYLNHIAVQIGAAAVVGIRRYQNLPNRYRSWGVAVLAHTSPLGFDATLAAAQL